MGEQAVSEVYFEEEQQPICAKGDWQCLLQNFYKGYVLFVEAIVETGVDKEGNPIEKVYGVEVSELTSEEIQKVIDNMKVVYPNAKEIRLHYCGNHIGKPCKLITV